MQERLCLTSSDHREPAEIGQPHSFSVSHEYLAPFTGSRIVFATDEAKQPVVVKFASHPRGSQREWDGLRMVQNIPGAQQGVMIGQTAKGTTGVVTELVQGEEMTVVPGDQVRYEFGQVLQNIHALAPIKKEEWQKYGRADRSFIVRSLEYWNRPENIVHFAHTMALPTLQKLFQAMESVPISQPSLTHQDIHEGQVLITKQLPVLIDFEVWQEADPLEDLAMYLVHLLREQKDTSSFRPLLEGYFLSKNYNDRTALLLSFYTLFNAVYAVAYLAKRKPEFFVLAQENLQRVTHFVQEERLWKIVSPAFLSQKNIPEGRGHEE